MGLVAVRSNAGVFGLGWGNKLADAGAMTAIASNTLGSDSASITFSSIPGTYDDLMVVCYIKSNGTSNESARLRFNSDTGSNYSNTYLYGDGSSPGYYYDTSRSYIQSYASSTGVSNQVAHILNYANSSYKKTCLMRSAQDNNGSGYTSLEVGLWNSTSAITSVTLVSQTSFRTGSVFALYGIKKAA
jgi:hypothetical protein